MAEKKLWRNILTHVLTGVALAAALIVIFGYGMMEKMLLPAPKSDKKAGNIQLYPQGAAVLDAHFLPPADESVPVILFSHGNGDTLSSLTDMVEEFAIRGYGILIYDYAGYGYSSGKASEYQSYRDILAAYDYLVKVRLIKPERIVAASFSVGCGPSCYLATQRKVAGLVLTAPFASAIEVMLPFPLPFNRYNNAKILSKTDVPLLIFHGADDEVIPLRNAHKLYNSAIGPKELLVIPQASHNNIFEVMGDKYWEKLAEFCKKYASQ